MLNSVGLQNPGVEAWLADELPALAATGARVVASIWGTTLAGYEKAAAALAASAAAGSVVAVEVNLSCPNLEGGRHMFASDPSATREAMAAVVAASGGRPAWAKLSPNVTDIVEIAVAARDGGASALTLVNTVKGMAIDPSTRRPRLGAGGGGLSGAAIRPVAVRAIFDVHDGPARRAHRGRGRRVVRRARGGAAPGGGVGGAGGDGHVRGSPGLRAGAGRAGGVVPAPPRGAGRRSGRTGPWSSVTD